MQRAGSTQNPGEYSKKQEEIDHAIKLTLKASTI